MPMNFNILDPTLPQKQANKLGSIVDDYQNSLARKQDAKAQEQTYKLNSLSLEKATNAMADEAQFKKLASEAAGDPVKLQQGLMALGRPKEAMELSKMQQEQQNAKIDRAIKATSLQRDIAGQIAANPTPEPARQLTAHFLQTIGADEQQAQAGMQEVEQVIAQGPEALKQWAIQHSVTAEQRLPKLQEMKNGQQSWLANTNPLAGPVGQPVGPVVTAGQPRRLIIRAELSRNQAAERGTTCRRLWQSRGENRAATQGIARERLELDKEKAKNQQGMIINDDGTISYTGSGKPLTGEQGKATGFATRAAQASKIVENIGEGGDIQPGLIKRAAQAVPLVGGGLATTLNFTQSADQQAVEQAQRDFINAILRQESGAAIAPSEFDSAKQQYFPQPGDSAQVKAQKTQNRDTAIRALNVSAGPGMARVEKPTGPQIGDVEDGHVFLGGDPADAKSWKVKK